MSGELPAVSLIGLRRDFAKYERDIISGKTPCPFEIEFRDASRNIITKTPLPLTLSGKPKIDIFGD